MLFSVNNSLPVDLLVWRICLCVYKWFVLADLCSQAWCDTNLLFSTYNLTLKRLGPFYMSSHLEMWLTFNKLNQIFIVCAVIFVLKAGLGPHLLWFSLRNQFWKYTCITCAKFYISVVTGKHIWLNKHYRFRSLCLEQNF